MANEPAQSPKPTKRQSRRAFLKRAALFCGLPLAASVWAREIEPFWLDFREIELSIPGLPPGLDGFRLAQLTDLHMDVHVPAGYLQRVIDRVNSARPHAVAITGDVVNHNFEFIEPAARLLAKIDAPKFVCFGNHDYAPYTAKPGFVTVIANQLQPALEEIGCVVLRNGAAVMQRGAERLWLVGLEDMWTNVFNPPAAFAGVDRDAVSICLSHNPDSAVHCAPFGPKLILSGHTHGGQIRIPFLGAPLLPTIDRRLDQGLFDLGGGTQLYVSRGVGYLLKARFCCRPEVPVFVLRSAGGRGNPSA